MGSSLRRIISLIGGLVFFFFSSFLLERERGGEGADCLKSETGWDGMDERTRLMDE